MKINKDVVGLMLKHDPQCPTLEGTLKVNKEVQNDSANYIERLIGSF
jgi:hypothetical protein